MRFHKRLTTYYYLCTDVVIVAHCPSLSSQRTDAQQSCRGGDKRPRSVSARRWTWRGGGARPSGRSGGPSGRKVSHPSSTNTITYATTPTTYIYAIAAAVSSHGISEPGRYGLSCLGGGACVPARSDKCGISDCAAGEASAAGGRVRGGRGLKVSAWWGRRVRRCAMREARARRGRQVRDRRGCVRSETGNCAACEICVRGCWANARLVDQRAADEVSA